MCPVLTRNGKCGRVAKHHLPLVRTGSQFHPTTATKDREKPQAIIRAIAKQDVPGIRARHGRIRGTDVRGRKDSRNRIERCRA